MTGAGSGVGKLTGSVGLRAGGGVKGNASRSLAAIFADSPGEVSDGGGAASAGFTGTTVDAFTAANRRAIGEPVKSAISR